jgi:hypothetical protein
MLHSLNPFQPAILRTELGYMLCRWACNTLIQVLVIGGEEENLAGEIKEEEEQRGGRADRELSNQERCMQFITSIIMPLPMQGILILPTVSLHIRYTTQSDPYTFRFLIRARLTLLPSR